MKNCFIFLLIFVMGLSGYILIKRPGSADLLSASRLRRAHQKSLKRPQKDLNRQKGRQPATQKNNTFKLGSLKYKMKKSHQTLRTIKMKKVEKTNHTP